MGFQNARCGKQGTMYDNLAVQKNIAPLKSGNACCIFYIIMFQNWSQFRFAVAVGELVVGGQEVEGRRHASLKLHLFCPPPRRCLKLYIVVSLTAIVL